MLSGLPTLHPDRDGGGGPLRSLLIILLLVAPLRSHAQAPIGRWSPRHSHVALAHAGKLWVMGGSLQLENYPSVLPKGFPADKDFMNDVWSSNDGAKWTLITPAAPWYPRDKAGGIVHEGKMLVIGGSNWHHRTNWHDQGFFNDVWGSSDGAQWSLETRGNRFDCAEWSPRANPKLVSLEGSHLCLLGGIDLRTRTCECDFRTDVWDSTDGGDTWNMNGGFEEAGTVDEYAVVQFEARAYILRPNGVWRSNAAAGDWERIADSVPWGERRYFNAVAFKGAIWVLGGWDDYDPAQLDYIYHRDVWRSVDGKEWSKVVEQAAWGGRCQSACVALGDSLWLLGGLGSAELLNDVWRSADGLEWVQVLPSDLDMYKKAKLQKETR